MEMGFLGCLERLHLYSIMWSLKTRRGDNHPWKMVAQALQMASTAKLLMTPGQGSPKLAAVTGIEHCVFPTQTCIITQTCSLVSLNF